MKEAEKQVSYTAYNSYLTLNEITPKTRNIWFVFHGIGYLSRFFISYFDSLDSDENYIIAPQAPSKYYLSNQYKHVGASWLTREKTEVETGNVLRYINKVYQAEKIPADRKLLVFGFSQGVSVAMRWVARMKIQCSHLILYAGGIPNELRPEDFDFLDESAKITVLVGDSDEFISADRLREERTKIITLFGEGAEIKLFKGGHEIKKELLPELLV